MLKMAVEVARVSIKDEAKIKGFLSDIMTHKALRGEDWNAISPEVACDIWRKLCQVTGEDDPLRELKDEQNRRALQLYPVAEEAVLKSTDPFHTAILFAILGNALDVMIGAQAKGGQELIARAGQTHANPDHVDRLRRRLDKGRKVLYFTDNCGEIVFDKLFIETLRKQYDLDLTLITRTMPILNDATYDDAQRLGFTEIATVMVNGIQEPLPGTILSKTSPEIKQRVRDADLILAKGVGNYDSLTEEADLWGKITYLFHGKCHPICSSQNASPGELIISHG
jgi:hypothetical protein